MRKLIKHIAPMAAESIAYGMPAYKLHNKPLVYFGGYEKHIGFYATPTGHEAFKISLANISKAKVRFNFRLIKSCLKNWLVIL